jgi:hypothetical protein
VNAGRELLGRGCQLLFSDTFPAYSDTKKAKNNQSGKFHLHSVANVRSLFTAKRSPEKRSFPEYLFFLSLLISLFPFRSPSLGRAAGSKSKRSIEPKNHI